MTQKDSGNYQSLYDALNGAAASYYRPAPSLPLKIATKRSRHSARFADRIQKNAESVDQLISVIKRLNKLQGTETEVDELIDIAKALLDNNAKLREQVGEALQDIPN